MKTTNTKSVQWSYPSSPNAVKFGFAKTGCYSVEVKKMKTTPGRIDVEWEELRGFSNKAAAVCFAETLPYEWDKYSAHDK